MKQALKLIFLFTIYLPVAFTPLVFAKSNLSDKIKPTPQQSYPGSPSYPLKRLSEKVFLKFLFFPNLRINFEKNLLDKRFSELIFVVDNDLLDEIQRSSERFAYEAGIYTNDLLNGSKESKEKVKADFNQYTQNLQLVRDVYPANSSYWMLIEHDINSLKILSSRLD